MNTNGTVMVAQEAYDALVTLFLKRPLLRHDRRIFEALIAVLEAMSNRSGSWADAFDRAQASYTHMRGRWASGHLRSRKNALRFPSIAAAIDNALEAVDRLPRPTGGKTALLIETQETREDAETFVHRVCHTFCLVLDGSAPRDNTGLNRLPPAGSSPKRWLRRTVPRPAEEPDGLFSTRKRIPSSPPSCAGSPEDHDVVSLDAFRKRRAADR